MVLKERHAANVPARKASHGLECQNDPQPLQLHHIHERSRFAQTAAFAPLLPERARATATLKAMHASDRAALWANWRLKTLFWAKKVGLRLAAATVDACQCVMLGETFEVS